MRTFIYGFCLTVSLFLAFGLMFNLEISFFPWQHLNNFVEMIIIMSMLTGIDCVLYATGLTKLLLSCVCLWLATIMSILPLVWLDVKTSEISLLYVAAISLAIILVTVYYSEQDFKLDEAQN